MANTFNIEELGNEEVRLIANIHEKDYAYSLLRTSAFDDDQKAEYDDILSDEITLEKLDDIINELNMNQAESINPSMTEIHKKLDERLARDN
jgi:hypothetical protein